SGNFLAFRAKTAQNTVKPEKTGFAMAITARLRPVFCVFRPKIPRTFWGKCTEQSSRKKLVVGGFEPEKVRLLYPAPKIPEHLLVPRYFLCQSGLNLGQQPLASLIRPLVQTDRRFPIPICLP
ncbi:MAG: hypothetical protein SPI09_06125, partial [Candidatus Limivicinus sp.]|nr:hypothetical protein [Candidatus Limivicinus sp.]